MMVIKKSFFFFLITIIFFSLIGFILNSQWVSAAEREGRPLEINYPEMEGVRPETTATPVPDYVKYIFNFAIWVSGLIALVVLIYGGFRYLTSAGSPEKVKDAKEQIAAALLGLLILFGSYLILISINPELVVFHLKELSPIISTLQPGVLLCKEPVKVDEAWTFMEEYKYDNPAIDRQKEIKKELDLILKNISDKCYTAPGKGNIKSDFDNKVTDIYFIPNVETRGELEYETEYGAILYEGKNYEDYSHPFYGHLIDPGGGWEPYHKSVNFDASSIKPFILIYEPDRNWEAILYQEPNRNKGFPNLSPYPYSLESGWWIDIAIPTPPQPPKSIEVTGDLIAVLWKRPDGENDSFYNEIDNNLLDNYNIVNYEPCIEHPIKGCAVAAATRLSIIAARIY